MARILPIYCALVWCNSISEQTQLEETLYRYFYIWKRLNAGTVPANKEFEIWNWVSGDIFLCPISITNQQIQEGQQWLWRWPVLLTKSQKKSNIKKILKFHWVEYMERNGIIDTILVIIKKKNAGKEEIGNIIQDVF